MGGSPGKKLEEKRGRETLGKRRDCEWIVRSLMGRMDVLSPRGDNNFR